jgi:hypothetical protein
MDKNCNASDCGGKGKSSDRGNQDDTQKTQNQSSQKDQKDCGK